MPRRSYRRRSSEGGEGGIAVFALIGLYALYRWAEALPRAWQIAAGVGALSVIFLLAWSLTALVGRLNRRRRLRAELMALTPNQFEERVQLLLADLGWTNLQRRGGSGDRGVDLVGQYEGQRYVIQCKRYQKNVPPAMVRDLVGALHIQKADRALLVTTSGFTRQGYAEVRDQRVELWDGPMLEQQLAEADARRADPARLRAARRRRNGILGAGIVLNGMLVAWAFAVAGPQPLISPAAAVRATQPSSVIPLPAESPTATLQAVPTEIAAGVSSPVPVPAASTTVFNGGNLRAAPSLDAAILNQVNADETVTLLGRSSDGIWFQIRDALGQVGWMHRTLLNLTPGIEQTVPTRDV